MINKSIGELLKEAEQKSSNEREQFIQARTQQEQEVNAFLERFKKLPSQHLSKFPLITMETTFQTLFPSLYESVIDQDKYDTEYAAFSEFLDSVRTFEDAVNKSAKESLLAYLSD